MHKNSQHSARDSEIVRVSVSLPIAATLYLLTRTAPRSPTTILSGGAANVSRRRVVTRCKSIGDVTGSWRKWSIQCKEDFSTEAHRRPRLGRRCERQQYISHHRPPAISRKIGSALRAGSAARSVAPEIVFGRGRVPSETAPQSPCGCARAPASRRPATCRVPERGGPHGARISVARRPRAASGALPARWPPCSGGGAWRCCGWSRCALPPARPAASPAPRKMRPRRRLARLAQVRRRTLPSNRCQRRQRRQRSTSPLTPGGGGQAHVWAAQHYCAPRARSLARTYAAAPPQPLLPTPVL